LTRPEPKPVDIEALAAGVRGGDRSLLARAITLVESRRPDQRKPALALLAALLPDTGRVVRVGVSGVPGVGKSTLIERLGMQLVEAGHCVAVLAVDPSSTLSGGSILGDKSRMSRLAQDDRAYIRPSPNALTLGGVARRTRETMLVCEAAGYDVVLVETVGVGQSETMVADMVDFFLVLMLPGAGDELQGMKKGIVELADGVAVNKADGDTERLAEVTGAEYSAALRYIRARRRSWQPEVTTVSAQTGRGMEELWSMVSRHNEAMKESGEWQEVRREQRQGWLWTEIEGGLLDAFRGHPEVTSRLGDVESRVDSGEITPAQGARELLSTFGVGPEE